jgi:high-affinity iron transporter
VRRRFLAAALLALTALAARYALARVERLVTPAPPAQVVAAGRLPRYDGLKNPVQATPDALEAGQRLYMRYCAFCHGAAGRGDGPAARALTPPPTDFGGLGARGMSDGRFFGYVTQGVPGTAMPAWGRVLGEQERWQIITFIRSAFQSK